MKYSSARLSHFLHFYAMVMLLAHVLILLSSWVASIYIDDINALLAPRGIRWMCSSVMRNFSEAPLAVSLMTLMAAGVMRKSGLQGIFHRHVTMKKRNAMRITSVIALAILALFSLLIFIPNAVLLSAFGTISHSSFSHGWFGLLMIYIVVVSSVYGYTSGHFRSMGDIVDAHASLLSSAGSVFVCIFLSSQVVGAISYTSVMQAIGDDGTWLCALSYVAYYLPLAAALVLAQ